ncbi:MAG: prepilin-type N-terminal cleavage/methylation domain-containing protein [Methylophilus sp.]|nr:prepilin-type N-terminal cleavage/methylation domain-containing protein [Methylophilus sp.]
MKKRQKQHLYSAYNKGFTIIELLFVIAIIGILASIAIPKYADYVEKSNVSIAIQDIAMMSALIKAYDLDAGDFPDALADIGLGNKLDPWGSPYQYLNLNKNGNGGARKDKKLNPLNSDFDLYSMGKDGKTKTQITQKDSVDDVLRANDGAFIDLASKY